MIKQARDFIIKLRWAIIAVTAISIIGMIFAVLAPIERGSKTAAVSTINNFSTAPAKSVKYYLLITAIALVIVLTLLALLYIAHSLFRREVIKRMGLEKIFNGIFEGTANGIMLFDNQCRIKSINNFCLRALEEEKSKILGRKFEDFWQNENKIKISQGCRKALSGEQAVIEERFIAKSGRVYYFSIVFSPIYEADNKISSFAGIFADITDKINAEFAVLEKENKYRIIFETSRDALIMIKNDIIVDCNKAALDLFGLMDKNDILNKTIIDFCPEKQPDGEYSSSAYVEKMETAKVTGYNFFEWKHIRKSGEIFHAEVSLSKIELGGMAVFQALIRDVTEKKDMQEVLQAGREKIKVFANTLPTVLFLVDEEGKFLDVYSSESRLFYIEPSKIKGRNVREVLPKIFAEQSMNVIKKTIATGEMQKLEYELPVLDGTKRWFEARTSLLEAKTDGKKTVTWLAIDITERKKMEQELRKLNSFEMILTEISAKLISITRDEIDNIVNDALKNIVRYASADRGHIIIFSKGNENVPVVYEWNESGIESESASLQNMSSDQFEWWAHRMLKMEDIRINSINDLPKEASSEKEFFHAMKTKSAIAVPMVYKDKLMGFIGMHFVKKEIFIPDEFVLLLKLAGEIFVNAFKRREYESEMKKALDEAEKANNAKSEFLTSMSHEIRTPLNSIIGMTELVQETTLDEQQREFLKIILSSSEALLSIINDILDFSRIESGAIEIHNVVFDLKETVENVISVFSRQVSEKNIELLYSIDEKAPAKIIGDPARVKQVLTNLVSNAVKFTDKGEIFVKIEEAASSKTIFSAKTKLKFSVKDTGIGIDKDDQKKLFQKFSQAGVFKKRNAGTGLGLSISKALVEIMGGKIGFESEKGKGSTFYFELFFDSLKEKAEKPVILYPDINGLTALIVDQNDTARFLFAKKLQSWGMKIYQVKEPSEAENILKNTDIRVILLDNRDAVKVAAELKKNSINKEVKIILITGIENLSAEASGESEINEVIPKPVKQSDLLQAIMKVLRIEKAKIDRYPEKKPGKETNLADVRVLLAEDNEDNLKLAKLILEKEKCVVEEARDGRQAVDLYKKSLYNIILMDIMMPELDGFQATKEIRKYEIATNAYSSVPIVAFTAHAIEGYRDICIKNGLDDYITKPIVKADLLDCVRNWVSFYKNILVVDDSSDNLLLLENYLKHKEQLKLFFAKNGEDALELFKNHSVFLAIVDALMPGMSGVETIKKIRALRKGFKTPIIAMTANDNPEESENCLKAGANVSLVKPIKKADLFNVLSKFIKDI